MLKYQFYVMIKREECVEGDEFNYHVKHIDEKLMPSRNDAKAYLANYFNENHNHWIVRKMTDRFYIADHYEWDDINNTHVKIEHIFGRINIRKKEVNLDV